MCMHVRAYVGVGWCLLVSHGRPYSCRHFYKPAVIGNNGGRNRVDHIQGACSRGCRWVGVGVGTGLLVWRVQHSPVTPHVSPLFH